MSDWQQERSGQVQPSKAWPISSTFLALIAAFLLCAVWMLYRPDHARALVFPFVFIGFVISLCVHEFGHAIVAYHCGDRTVRDKGYLTLDPLRYTDLQFSIIFPLIIMALGGIGLPGGAVYINMNYLRRRSYGALVSAGGPLGTAVVLAVLMALFAAVPQLAKTAPVLYAALAFLALLQVTALIFNLIPCPGLDGWGIIEPFLPEPLRALGRRGAPIAILLLVAALFFVPGLSGWFWQTIFSACAFIGLDARAAFAGLRLFQFWQ
ncbi:MAG TPA: site-2 protease family protein [Hyphomicrobiaceae bacterium]|nr:site-2 protease family protein [Hyphomicrobiaceae bacterium]